MAEYYYLVSSLPMPRLREPLPMGSARFLDSCAEWLPTAGMDSLRRLELAPAAAGDADDFEEWDTWETCLRARLARQRGGELKRDPEKFIPPESEYFSEIERGVQEAAAAKTPLEREIILDTLRWSRLDTLESGHPFDLRRLQIYKLRLLINEKWESRVESKAEEIFNKLVAAATKPAEIPG